MQINNSYGSSSSFYSRNALRDSSNNKSDIATDFSSLANYGETTNSLFQNLLADPSVQDNITLNDDGTYSFSSSSGTLQGTTQEAVAELLINEQNGFQNSDPNAVSPYTTSELAMFRETTGYNLVQAGGLYTVVDDYGNAPSSSDQGMVKAAWETFDLAKSVKELYGDGSDLTSGELANALQARLAAGVSDGSIIDDLIEKIS